MQNKRLRGFLQNLALVLLSLSALFLLGSMPLALLSAILLLAFIRYSFSHWRCPHCGEYLGRVGKGIQLCPYCHERLDK